MRTSAQVLSAVAASIAIVFVLLVDIPTTEAAAKKCPRNTRFNSRTNKCERICPDGTKRAQDRRDCVPICPNCPLKTGRCLTATECRCHNGFVKNSTNECTPVCRANTCQSNAQCLRGLCECDPGYQLRAKSNECLPVCDFCDEGEADCTVGTTQCTCWDNYEEQDEITKDNRTVRQCAPKCDPSCINGRCIEATTCQCNAGYQMRNGSRNECDPVCTSPCSNGDCVAPNECRCSAGFEPLIDGAGAAHPNQCRPACLSGYKQMLGGVCAPQCSLPCVNGECVQPDVCACLAGFRPNETAANVCDPVCETPECVNGICVAPEQCECADGYDIDALRFDGQCEPVCVGGCAENEWCSGPNRCECIEGFAMEKTYDGDGHHCVAVCLLGCIGGRCVAPARCECSNGLVWMDGTCVCPDGLQQRMDGTGCEYVTADEPVIEVQLEIVTEEESTTVSTVPTTEIAEVATQEVSVTASTEQPTTEKFTTVSTEPSTPEQTSETVDEQTDSDPLNIITTTAARDIWTPEIMPPDVPHLHHTEVVVDFMDGFDGRMFETRTDNIRGELKMVSVGSVMQTHWLYAIILTAMVLTVLIVVAIVWYRKVDYNVKKSESKLGVYYNTGGSIMAYA